MFDKLRPRSVYDVMAAIACFGVLAGGTAYAAATITGAEVVDESLTGADVKGKGGSASTPAVNGSLSGVEIGGQGANPANGTPFIDGTLTQWDVQNNSLTGDDVANNSLKGADIDEGSLVGGPGSPSGAAGGDLSGSYPNPEIRSDAVGSNEIASAAVGSSEIADRSVRVHDIDAAYARIVNSAVDAAYSRGVTVVAANVGVVCLRIDNFFPKNAVATIDPAGANTRDHVSVSVVPSVVVGAQCPTSADAVAYTVNQAGTQASLPFYIHFN